MGVKSMLNRSVITSIIGNQKLRELISEIDIKRRTSEIATEISENYKGKIPIVIGVLNGSFLFLADIVRELDIEYEVDFIKISSYGNSKNSTGTVRLLKDISADITGRDVILIEDIVDTGLSLKFLKKRFENASPNSLAFVTLLYKPRTSKIDFNIDYIGFKIGDEFVVGYGLDYKQKLRGLPSIYTLTED
jgi:hypoxanthine phosphoribosyltransferase